MKDLLILDNPNKFKVIERISAHYQYVVQFLENQ